jgi:hypothetical protein
MAPVILHAKPCQYIWSIFLGGGLIGCAIPFATHLSSHKHAAPEIFLYCGGHPLISLQSSRQKAVTDLE